MVYCDNQQCSNMLDDNTESLNNSLNVTLDNICPNKECFVNEAVNSNQNQDQSLYQENELQQDVDKIFEENDRISIKDLEICLKELYKRNYRVIKPLSKLGGEGIVILGYRTTSNQEYAIKLTIFDQEGVSSEERYKYVLSYYQKQSLIMDRIRDFNNLIQIQETFFIKENLIIVQIMDLCEKDLSQEITDRILINQPFSFQELTEIFFQLIEGMIEIHCNSIIHFDIKPKNILIQKNQKCVISDFGISMFQREKGFNQNQISGTLLFSSPEQLACLNSEDNTIKQMKISQKSDIYSMGITFLKLIGFQFNEQDFLRIQKGEWPSRFNEKTYYKEDQIKLMIHQIRFNMINKNSSLRKNAIQIKVEMMKFIKEYLNLNDEIFRIQKLIGKFQLKNTINYKYLSYLHFMLANLGVDSEKNYQIAIDKAYQVKNLQNSEYLYYKIVYGDYLVANRQFEKAIKILNECLIQEKQLIDSNSSIQLASIYGSLGNYYKFEGNLQRQIEFFQEDLQIKQILFSEIHPDLAESLNNVGGSLIHIGKYEQAIYLLNKSLIMKQQIFPKYSSEIDQTLNNLGILYTKLGQYQKSIDYFKYSLLIRETIFEQNNLQIAETLNYMGYIYGAIANYRMSQGCLQKSLQIRRTHLKEDHPDIADSLHSLGTIAGIIGDFQKQKQFYFDAMKIRENLKNDSDLAQSFHSLGVYYQNIGRYKKSIQLFEKALEIRKILFNLNHPDIATTLDSIGISKGKLGLQDQSFSLINEAYRIRQSIFKKQHPDIADSLNNFAISLVRQKQYQTAQSYAIKALDMRQQIYNNQDHPQIAQSLQLLAVLNEKQIDNEQSIQKSIDFNQKSFEMRKRLYLGNHPDIAEALQGLANMQSMLSNQQKAIEYYQNSLNMREQIYKGNHPDIAQSLNNLSRSYLKLGENSKSLSYFKQAQKMRQQLFEENRSNISQSQSLSNESNLEIKSQDQQAASCKILSRDLRNSYPNKFEHIQSMIATNGKQQSYGKKKEFEQLLLLINPILKQVNLNLQAYLFNI